MTKFEQVKAALENVPQFRERKYRSHFLLIMALRDAELIPKDRKVASGDKVEIIVGTATNPGAFARLGPSYGSYERAWRQVTEKHKNLRGSDYDMKEELEAEKLEELGYTQGQEYLAQLMNE